MGTMSVGHVAGCKCAVCAYARGRAMPVVSVGHIAGCKCVVCVGARATR